MPIPVSQVQAPPQDCIPVMFPDDAHAAGPEVGPSLGSLTPSSVFWHLGCSGLLLPVMPAGEGGDLFS